MRVAHLTSVHSALDNRILHKECRTLAEAGHDVTLVAPHIRDEDVHGVRIKAIGKASGRGARVTRTAMEVYRAALFEDADVYHFHDFELFPIGLMLKAKGKRVIYDAHEDLPRQIFGKHWIHPRLRHIVSFAIDVVESCVIRFFDGIVSATPSIALRFPEKKTAVVQNFPRLEEFGGTATNSYQARPPVIVYVGALSRIRGIAEIVQAMELIPARFDARLFLAGSFNPQQFETKVRSMPGWDRVVFLGWQSRSEVARLLSQARVGLVLFHPLPNHVNAQPNKLFEYMSGGIPVVASDFPLWREIVSGADCGLLADPLSPQAIADAVTWLLEHGEDAEQMGLRGHRAVVEKYNWEIEEKNLLRFYERLFM